MQRSVIGVDKSNAAINLSHQKRIILTKKGNQWFTNKTPYLCVDSD